MLSIAGSSITLIKSKIMTTKKKEFDIYTYNEDIYVMGWKSTKEISRKKAIKLIYDRVEDATDEELECALSTLGYGDNFDLKYCGCNFLVFDENDTKNEDDDNR